jgi:hypothetical protein
LPPAALQSLAPRICRLLLATGKVGEGNILGAPPFASLSLSNVPFAALSLLSVSLSQGMHLSFFILDDY